MGPTSVELEGFQLYYGSYFDTNTNTLQFQLFGDFNKFLWAIFF